ncbi:MAG TPA: hypothetical protein VFE47_13975 [Tepidisphaeraceae bacterium]|nr:hypothetical protein [Tepidisphaeraceae bacterium]
MKFTTINPENFAPALSAGGQGLGTTGTNGLAQGLTQQQGQQQGQPRAGPG